MERQQALVLPVEWYASSCLESDSILLAEELGLPPPQSHLLISKSPVRERLLFQAEEDSLRRQASDRKSSAVLYNPPLASLHEQDLAPFA